MRSVDRQFADELGMADRDRQGHRSAHAVAEEVGLPDLEVFHEGGCVVSHLLDRQRAIDVGCVSMPLQLDGDHLPILRERRIRGCPTEGSVEQHERLPGAVNLVVHLEAVDVGVSLRPVSRDNGLGFDRPVARSGGHM
jgi:hypothetical protein